jgi:pyrrolidone-carboxylate peptidase
MRGITLSRNTSGFHHHLRGKSAWAGATITVALLLGPAGIVSTASASGAACLDANVSPTVEEARLDTTVPDQNTAVGRELIKSGGFSALTEEFAAALCGVQDSAGADGTITSYGEKLWSTAVQKAQAGADDDRPLYWARLAMAQALRQWQPVFTVTDEDRSGWQKRFEYSSRGITTSQFTAATGTRKLFVSGFDPFLLNDDIRHSNPSGSVALRMDGRQVSVNGRTVQVQTVMLPVRFADFEAGIVEDAFAAHLASGEQRADMMTSVSQGEPDRFDLEVYNGRRRSTAVGDNLDVQGGGQTNVPAVAPGVGPGPEFTSTTLPLEAMQAAGEGEAFPVVIDKHVVQLKPPNTVRESPDGPTEGWHAVQGGGGGYLSNEVAYRLTRLVLESGQTLPSGHLHTPELKFDPSNSTEISDSTLTANRSVISAEAERILLGGVGSLS